jgi:hypothetical protein
VPLPPRPPGFRAVRARTLLADELIITTLCARCRRACTMVKNKGKGGKNRRRGKADGDMKRELVFKEDGQGDQQHQASQSSPERFP